jgi:hypothetical protein
LKDEEADIFVLLVGRLGSGRDELGAAGIGTGQAGRSEDIAVGAAGSPARTG